MSLFDEEEDDFEIEMDKEKFDQIIVRAEEEKRKKQRTTTTNAFDFMKNSQQQQQQEVLQQQNYQHQHHAVKKISILPSEGGTNNAGRVKFELFISAPIARKFDRLVAKFDAAFARESAEEYERREQLEEINNGTVMKNIITWDGIPYGRLDLVVSSLKRQFGINDAVNILYPHPFVRRSLRSGGSNDSR
ncbi:unnamed protein product [Bathycoccus prasinos]